MTDLEKAIDKIDAAYNRAYEMGHEELASDDEGRAAVWFFQSGDLRDALGILRAQIDQEADHD